MKNQGIQMSMKRIIARNLFPTLLLTLLLAACTTPTAEPPAPTPTDAPAADPELDGVLIFEKSGGIAGIQEGYVIHEDGRILQVNGEPLESQPDLAPRLFADVADLGFYEMRSSYVPEDTCCDRFTYIISVQDDGRTHNVTTIDDAPDEPVELRQLIAKINFILHGE